MHFFNFSPWVSFCWKKSRIQFEKYLYLKTRCSLNEIKNILKKASWSRNSFFNTLHMATWRERTLTLRQNFIHDIRSFCRWKGQETFSVEQGHFLILHLWVTVSLVYFFVSLFLCSRLAKAKFDNIMAFLNL